MSAGVAIQAKSLGKSFRIYAQPSDRLIELVTRRERHRSFCALQGVDLQIMRGETVGIVGRNGSGKSTLLQLIAGTLQPTTGSVVTHGRVAALLELGSGFNPDFTGRENVYLNAQVMGLRRHEVEARFERIERFADIGHFIDQPVRTYSSGMLVRLAFAVAINTDPDVLIIDEALAVGDEAFQRKCFARLEAIRDEGTTILFVSHASASVVHLCDRAVLLDAGELLLVGEPKVVVAQYQKLLHAPEERRLEIREALRMLPVETLAPAAGADSAGEAAESEATGTEAADIRPWPVELAERFDAGLFPAEQVVYEERGARIVGARVLNAQGESVNVLLPGRPYTFAFEVEFTDAADAVEFGMSIKSVDGIVLFGMSSHGRAGFIERVEAGATVAVEFRFATRFQPGLYYFNAGCQGARAGHARDFLHRILDVACFRIEGPETDRYAVGFYDLAVEPAASWSLGG